MSVQEWVEIIGIKNFPKGRDETHNPNMTEVAIPHGEHKEPKQLIQGYIEGGENTPRREWKQTLYPQLKQERC